MNDEFRHISGDNFRVKPPTKTPRPPAPKGTKVNINKEELKQKREMLLEKKSTLEMQLLNIEKEIKLIDNLEKPYVANVSAYGGHYSMQFKTEEQARKKLSEYASKKYFKNGLNYGVYLFKWNEDTSKTLLEVIPIGKKDFKANI